MRTVLAVLRQLEWTHTIHGEEKCLICENLKKFGHEQDCDMFIAIEEVLDMIDAQEY